MVFVYSENNKNRLVNVKELVVPFQDRRGYIKHIVRIMQLDNSSDYSVVLHTDLATDIQQPGEEDLELIKKYTMGYFEIDKSRKFQNFVELRSDPVNTQGVLNVFQKFPFTEVRVENPPNPFYIGFTTITDRVREKFPDEKEFAHTFSIPYTAKKDKNVPDDFFTNFRFWSKPYHKTVGAALEMSLFARLRIFEGLRKAFKDATEAQLASRLEKRIEMQYEILIPEPTHAFNYECRVEGGEMVTRNGACVFTPEAGRRKNFVVDVYTPWEDRQKLDVETVILTNPKDIAALKEVHDMLKGKKE